MGKSARIKRDRRVALAQLAVVGESMMDEVNGKWTKFEPLNIEEKDCPKGRVWLGGNKVSILDEIFFVFHNNLYSVLVGESLWQEEVKQNVIHLSIKRHDKKPIRDWRHLQRIKNELIGPENEGLELFPAESRLMDTANQFHLWILADPRMQIPFGYKDKRIVLDKANWPTAKQRPY